MKKIVLAMFFTSSVFASESPYDKFSNDKNFTNKTSVEWITVPDIQATCDADNLKRTGKRFGFSVEACSHWDKSIFGNTCVIYTERKVSYWTLGHELRHCFQGFFHK